MTANCPICDGRRIIKGSRCSFCRGGGVVDSSDASMIKLELERRETELAEEIDDLNFYVESGMLGSADNLRTCVNATKRHASKLRAALLCVLA